MGTVAKYRFQSGFTMIEMLVVAGIIGFLSVGIVGTFMGTIRGNQKARLQAEIKNQGDFTIASMERALRNSRTLPTCTGNQVNYEISADALTHGFRINTGKIQKSDNVGAGSWSDVSGSTVSVTGSFDCLADPAGYSSGAVVIQLNVSATGTGETLTQAFQTSVAIRSSP